MLLRLTAQALEGIPVSIDDALALDSLCTTDELADAADKVRRRWNGNVIDTCSIVNARSGRCPEDCKWCAQSRRHATGIDEYDYIPEEDALHAARLNRDAGVHRFSLVTSGRRVTKAHLRRFCDMYRRIADETGLYLCASMGLLGRDELLMLKEAGVKRYHCNLETASEYFPSLCTTHTHADKLRTIATAREIGMDVCSGGIIGMGETLRHRLMLAAEARDAGAVSMPVNILNPIKGTPLQDIPLISEDEIIRSIALMRLVAPKMSIRFAGGRMRVSSESQARMLLGGVNGALVGDLLTTVGNTLDEDTRLFAATGYSSTPVSH